MKAIAIIPGTTTVRLVAGLGPIGLLAALALRLRGAEVFGLDIADAGSAWKARKAIRSTAK
jgi:threonine dehydrogenase-like Zn-dependent dehydrogenase